MRARELGWAWGEGGGRTGWRLGGWNAVVLVFL